MPRAAASSGRRGGASGLRGGGWRWLVWLVAGLGLLLVVVGLVIWQRGRGWLRGEEFRELVEEKVGAAAGGEVVLEPLEWRGWSAFSPGAEVAGGVDAGYRRIAVEALRVTARPGGVMRGAWELPRVKLDRVIVEYRAGEGVDLGGVDSLEALEAEPVVATATESAPGRWDGWLPQRVELGEVQIGRLDVQPEAAPGVRAEGIALRVERQAGGDGFVAVAEGGEVHLPLLPGFELRRLEARATPEAIFLSRGQLFRAERGQLALAGRLGLGPEVGTDLRIELAQLPLDAVVAADWKQRLEGLAQAELRYQAEGEGQELTGPVRVVGAQVTLLPVLDRLAEYFGSDLLRRVNFEDARCEVHWQPGRTELKDIELHSRGLLRVQGNVVLRGDAVGGVLQLGVTPGLLARLPEAEQRVFAQDRDGMRWTPVVLGGTLAKLEEDLSGRILSAAAQRMLAWLPDGVREQAAAGGELALGAVPLLGEAGESLTGAAEAAGIGGGVKLPEVDGLLESAGGAVERARGVLGADLGVRPGAEGAGVAGNRTIPGTGIGEPGRELIQRGGGVLGGLWRGATEGLGGDSDADRDDADRDGADGDAGQPSDGSDETTDEPAEPTGEL